MKKNSLPALTSLRFFAALAIIAFHFSINNAAMIPSFLYNIIKQGNMAVNFFFVLSGFVLAYNYLDKVVEPRRFWVARFARVYPVYLLALLLSLPAYLAAIAATTAFPIRVTLTSMLLELTLLQAWLPLNGCGINCPGWSISAEAFFYLIFPFVGAYFAKLRTRSALFVACSAWLTAIAINTPLWLAYSTMSDAAAKTLMGDVIAFNPLLNVSAFIVGLATGLVFLRRRQTPSATANSYRMTLLEIGALLLALVVIAYSGIPHALLRTGAASPLFALIIYTLALGEGHIAKLLSNRLLLILGEVSYAIYILQVPVGYWTRKLIEVTPLHNFGAIAYPVLYLPIIIGFSILSFYLLEKPIRGKILALFQKSPTMRAKQMATQQLSEQVS